MSNDWKSRNVAKNAETCAKERTDAFDFFGAYLGGLGALAVNLL
jgi:hypothetical protein